MDFQVEKPFPHAPFDVFVVTEGKFRHRAGAGVAGLVAASDGEVVTCEPQCAAPGGGEARRCGLAAGADAPPPRPAGDGGGARPGLDTVDICTPRAVVDSTNPVIAKAGEDLSRRSFAVAGRR